MRKILLVDGNNLLFRSYFAQLKTNLNSEWIPTTSYFFIKTIFSLLKKNSYDGLFIAFDSGKTNFRHQLFSLYKAHRPKTPEVLKQQFPLIFEWLKLTKISYFFQDNAEADDILASFVKKFSSKIDKIEIFSTDQDLYQILEYENVKIISPSKKTRDFQFIDKKFFLEKYEFSPLCFADYKSLVGDKSDNLHGIRGIGPKTASLLIKKYRNLEIIFSSTDPPLVKLKDKNKITSKTKEECFLFKKIIMMNFDFPLQITLEECSIKNISLKNKMLFDFYTKCRMYSFLKEQKNKNRVKKQMQSPKLLLISNDKSIDNFLKENNLEYNKLSFFDKQSLLVYKNNYKFCFLKSAKCLQKLPGYSYKLLFTQYKIKLVLEKCCHFKKIFS